MLNIRCLHEELLDANTIRDYLLHKSEGYLSYIRNHLEEPVEGALKACLGSPKTFRLRKGVDEGGKEIDVDEKKFEAESQSWFHETVIEPLERLRADL